MYHKYVVLLGHYTESTLGWVVRALFYFLALAREPVAVLRGRIARVSRSDAELRGWRGRVARRGRNDAPRAASETATPAPTAALCTTPLNQTSAVIRCIHFLQCNTLLFCFQLIAWISDNILGIFFVSFVCIAFIIKCKLFAANARGMFK